MNDTNGLSRVDYLILAALYESKAFDGISSMTQTELSEKGV